MVYSQNLYLNLHILIDTPLYTVIFFNYKILIISQHINDLFNRIKNLFQVFYHLEDIFLD